MGTARKRKRSRTGLETRDRIIDAALQTVLDEGLIGASARVIARTGNFNQALVFYHFGSIEELLLAALSRANDRRIGRFEERVSAIDSLAGLVEIAVELHESYTDDPDHSALTAIVAGWSSSSEVGKRILETLKPWDDMIEAALERSLADTAFASIVPAADLAHAVSSLFLGIELMSRLDRESNRTDTLFASLGGAAQLAGPILDGMRAGQKAGKNKREEAVLKKAKKSS